MIVDLQQKEGNISDNEWTIDTLGWNVFRQSIIHAYMCSIVFFYYHLAPVIEICICSNHMVL